MPTSREIVAQRPLQGSELRKIITKQVDHILSESGMFAGQIAYGRIAYEVRVILHLDNPSYPKAEHVIYSKPYPKDITEGEHGQPELAAIELLPLKDTSPEVYLAADELKTNIVSPNAARVENELPITVIRREQNSEMREELVTYAKDSLDGVNNPNPEPVITDVTELVRKELENRK